MQPPLLSITNLSKSFKSLSVLHNISLSLAKGEIVSIIGPSGCGKSTLLDIISGIQTPDKGEITSDEQSIIGIKGLTAYMPQDDVLFPWRTVIDNVILPLELAGIEKVIARKEAEKLFSVFGLAGFEHSYPNTLSGGMKQRASFLRTHLCNKEILLLDEPFGKLDALTRMQMRFWLLNLLKTYERSVLFITHDIDEAIMVADRLYIFSARPATVVAELTISLPLPRTQEQLTSPEFSQLKKKALRHLCDNSTNARVDLQQSQNAP
ncbi:MAG: ABC transporter ATP-binding protein [bacterium]